jgi:hypothetical protein
MPNLEATATTETFFVDVATDGSSSKIYVRPKCGSRSGVHVVKEPKGPGRFFHDPKCPHRGKIPVE